MLKCVILRGRGSTHEQVISHYGVRREPTVELSSRSLYNLACYYTCLEVWDEAYHQLRMSLESGAIAAWVGHDPALRPLKQHNPARWKQLVAPLLDESPGEPATGDGYMRTPSLAR